MLFDKSLRNGSPFFFSFHSSFLVCAGVVGFIDDVRVSPMPPNRHDAHLRNRLDCNEPSWHLTPFGRMVLAVCHGRESVVVPQNVEKVNRRLDHFKSIPMLIAIFSFSFSEGMSMWCGGRRVSGDELYSVLERTLFPESSHAAGNWQAKSVHPKLGFVLGWLVHRIDPNAGCWG